MRALGRKLLRDLARMKGPAISIGLVVCCGVAVFVAAVSCYGTLVANRRDYYAAQKFADVFATLERAPRTLARRPLIAIVGAARSDEQGDDGEGALGQAEVLHRAEADARDHEPAEHRDHHADQHVVGGLVDADDVEAHHERDHHPQGRRAEYGDERDPKQRAKLLAISPLERVKEMKKPMFTVTGGNDPRVPASEAEQVVKAIRANGGTVWHLLATNEGHIWGKKENNDYAFWSALQFYKQTLLGE